jgi:hypothetical protein
MSIAGRTARPMTRHHWAVWMPRSFRRIDGIASVEPDAIHRAVQAKRNPQDVYP